MLMSFYIRRRKKVLKHVFIGISIFAANAALFGLVSLLVPRQSNALIYHPLFFAFIVTAMAASLYKPLDKLFMKLFKNYLFKKKSFVHTSLSQLGEQLKDVLDLSEFANLVVNTFGEVLHLKSVALLSLNEEREFFEITSSYGWNISDAKRVKLPVRSKLGECIQDSGREILVRDSVLKSLSWQEANQLVHDFNSIRASWVIPLSDSQRIYGLIALSAASPESIFDEADFQLFREFSKAISKYLKNAQAYTHLKRKIVELQDEQSQIFQSTKIKAIEQLATGIAHQIHNPLTIISGKAQVLLLKKDKSGLDPKVEEVLKTIVKQTTRAAEITRKLLMFSQGSGAVREPLSLEQILDDTISLISYKTSIEHIQISRDIGTGIPPFMGNVHEMREVFFNLMMNAVQSVGVDGHIHCEIHYDLSEKIFEIIISDSGQGISRQNIEKLFNPFFTTRQESVGLGLFVTKQIVHKYGGLIRVDSEAGEGCTFIIRIPQTLDEPAKESESTHVEEWQNQ